MIEETSSNAGVCPNSSNTKSGALKGAGSQGRLDLEAGTGWKDVFWLIIFVAHILVLVFLAVMFVPSFFKEAKNNPHNKQQNPHNKQQHDKEMKDLLRKVISVLVVAAVAGIASVAVWFAIAKRYAHRIIQFSLGCKVATNVILFFLFLYLGASYWSLSFLGVAAISALFFYIIRNRIRFTGVLLELSVNVIQNYSGPIYVAFIFAVLQVAWSIFWTITALAIHEPILQHNGFVVFLFLVSFYWTAEVLKNIVHVTTAGVAATWWFFAEPRNPTSQSLKRATTTSLGSICFGSLLVAFISAVKTSVQSVAHDRDSSIVSAFAQCLLACLEVVLMFFNVYAFSRVAIYGTTFWQSGKDTFKLFESRGFDVIVNDDLTGIVLGLWALVGFAFSGGVSFAWASLLDYPVPVLFAVLGGCIGGLMTMLISRVLRSCVATFFITWAEQPSALQQSRPDMYLKLRDAVHRMYPDFESGF